MEWKQLISNKRFGQEHKHAERHDDRSEFKRDYDRLIFSSAFRRLQNKTQVFPLPGSIFVHNRLTHSLEVASVGMSIGNDISRRVIQKRPELKDTLVEEIGTIVSAACLAHDLGNPPFGHSGEKAIQTFFSEGPGQKIKSMVSSEFWDDITHFEGNANAFRILTHRFKGRRQGGFVMTYSMLASIVKYPFASCLAGNHGKFGFFASETESYRKIADELGIFCKSAPGEPLKYARHPLVYMVEAADDICYEIMDIEDSHKLKILSFAETEHLLLSFFDEDIQQKIRQRIIDEELTDENEKVVYMRASVIGKLENECVAAFLAHEEEILAGTFEGCLIDHISERQKKAYKECEKISYSKIYQSKPVLDIELSGYQIMATLMEVFIEAAVNPSRFYSKQLLRRVSSQYDIENENLEERIMAVIDYISGMTDIYALDIYQKINGISLPIV
ncbi:deoxyguanosinetriphosphate triphosphohydrolase [Segatella copri]|jgi:dGTPase|uniref:Deoxyguanosinetriphosphate triphosphohydrolase n=1 Tax=Segatella copri TaxID=165179 RepID=A0AAW5IAW7_9BACT|nr:deoxyguanosinetriphosphate triphosphohydrolase [Segatella copri]MBM0156615.1 deoxyguanosinetriphosphate triphosphohydrolase [Segatella copri]MCP9545907.1 deoxyguanosinetriphosphate triphosphohydrolase [Segatella copri]MCP9548696.1 deoxyguanosinetriphosphate triphosphohydrolase [Segatella copri]MCP9555184.1 deoxyguanosinetriphosphate triphosphohydrolase [Segatella copri]MCP9569698.1 deoxyguanosinetriphosphate triphosphohydrolase [Segatella copri]